MNASGGPRYPKCSTTNQKAVSWILLSVMGYAVLPLILWFGIQDFSPYIFVAVWYVTAAASHTLFRQLRGIRRNRRASQTVTDSRRYRCYKTKIPMGNDLVQIRVGDVRCRRVSNRACDSDCAVRVLARRVRAVDSEHVLDNENA